MSDPNAKRLMDMALQRAGLMPRAEYKTYPVNCLQCGRPATVKHTYLAGEGLSEDQISFWCEDDFDFMWLQVSVPKLRRSGLISHVSEAIVPASDPNEWMPTEPSFWRN